MKVTILTPSASRNAGGLFNSVRRGAIELQRQGAEICVFAPEDGYCNTDLPFWSPVDVTLYPTIGPVKFGVNLALRRKVEGEHPDILHLHGLWTYQSLVTRASRSPVVISPRGMLDSWALKNSWCKKKLALHLVEARNLSRATCFHALNHDEAEAIRAFGITSPIAIIPNGVDLPVKTRPDFPKWLSSDKRKVLLFLGRIHPKKGLSELLRGWSTLRRIAPCVARSWRLVIGGWDDGGHLEALRGMVVELGIENDVVFPGSVYHDEKHALLSHSDAFILPSYSEGLPMSVLEAWSYKLPVFMTRHCNLSFAFTQGAAIEITNSPEEISATLACWLGSEQSQEVGLKAHYVASEKFGWNRIAGQQIELYEWLLGKRLRPNFVEVLTGN